MAASEARDEDFACDLNGVILVAGLVEGVLDSVDYAVPHPEIVDRDLLLLVHVFDEVFNVFQLLLSPVRAKIKLGLHVELLLIHIFFFLLLDFLSLVALKALRSVSSLPGRVEVLIARILVRLSFRSALLSLLPFAG